MAKGARMCIIVGDRVGIVSVPCCFSNKHSTRAGDATLFFYPFTSRILTFVGERSDRTNVKIRLVNGQSPVILSMYAKKFFFSIGIAIPDF
jgi:hypothetical protein